MSSRRSACAPPSGGGPDRLVGRHAHLAHGDRDAERDVGRVAGAGIAVGGQRDLHARRRAAAARPGTARGWRTRRPAAAWPPCPSWRARRCRRPSRGCSGRPRRRRARPRSGRPGRGRAGWRGRAACSPLAIPACRIARVCSPSNAPCSQNTSIQDACGRARVEHRALDEVDVGVARPCSGGTTWAPRKVRSGRGHGGERSAALVGHGQAIAGLGLDGRRARAQRLVHQPVEVGLQLRCRTRRGWPRRWS